jgi:hypothetical protein
VVLAVATEAKLALAGGDGPVYGGVLGDPLGERSRKAGESFRREVVEILVSGCIQ